VVQGARYHLLHSGHTDSSCQPLTLDRQADAVSLGDQIHPVVTGADGVGDAPAPSSKLGRNEFFELDTRHFIDGRQIGHHASKVAPSVSSGQIAIPLNTEPQENPARTLPVAFWVKHQGRANPTTRKDPNILSIVDESNGGL